MAHFDEHPKVKEIAQRHSDEVESLQGRKATDMLKLYKTVRQDLRDRLDRFPRGTFTAQRTSGLLVQVDHAIQTMMKNLTNGMKDAVSPVIDRSMDALIKEVDAWDKYFTGAVVPVNFDAVQVASDTETFLFNKHEASIEAYSKDVRSRIASGIQESVLAQDNLSEIVQKVGLTFANEEWKLQRLVRTELMGVYSLGKLMGMQQLVDDEELPDLQKTLFHPMDTRTGADSKYAEELHLVVDVDQPFRYKWNNEWREFMAPPDRSNDRSILIPYRAAWSE